MKVFDAYASYYDLLYRDKDYEAEAGYVANLISRFAEQAQELLELGCGTGTHACLLAGKGYRVHGIDQSETMLQKAEERKKNFIAQDKISFEQGDARSYAGLKKYDAVISLFHVMSYMQTDADLQNAFATAQKNLKPGGLFIFDCWHGPAVLHDKPVVRRKNFSDDHTDIVRISTPQMMPDINTVNVHFDVSVIDKKSGVQAKLEEDHRMRYLFPEEISKLAKDTQMEMILEEEWLSGKKPGTDTWNVCYVIKKNTGANE
jgi:SAM-dependent methyltransferase